MLSVRFRALDVSGAVAGALISFATLLAGGLDWLAIIITFVLISSLLTRFRFDYKQKLDSAQEKDGRRSGETLLQMVLSVELRQFWNSRLTKKSTQLFMSLQSLPP